MGDVLNAIRLAVRAFLRRARQVFRRVPPLALEEGDLPTLRGETMLALLAVGPHRLHLYWEAAQAGKAALRIYDVTGTPLDGLVAQVRELTTEPAPTLALSLGHDGVPLGDFGTVGEAGPCQVDEVPIRRVDDLQTLGDGERRRDLSTAIPGHDGIVAAARAEVACSTEHSRAGSPSACGARSISGSGRGPFALV